MRYFDRKIPHEAETLNAVHSLISSYPDGVTYHRLMEEHRGDLRDASSVLECIYTLIDEKQIYSDQRWAGVDFLRDVPLHSKVH